MTDKRKKEKNLLSNRACSGRVPLSSFSKRKERVRLLADRPYKKRRDAWHASLYLSRTQKVILDFDLPHFKLDFRSYSFIISFSE